MSKELVAVLFALLALFSLAVTDQSSMGDEPIDPPTAEVGVGIEPGG